MANEFKHVAVGAVLTQAEYEATNGHVFDGQATGDLMYASSATQLSRFGIGTAGSVVHSIGGIPAWSSSAQSGAQLILLAENTSDTASSDARIEAKVGGTSGGDAFFITHVPPSVSAWAFGTDNDASDRFAIGAGFVLGANDALRITYATPPVVTYNTTHPTGTFDYVCAGCGRHQATEFACCGPVAWHDDNALARRAMLGEQSAIDQMCLLGVMERTFNNDGNPEVFTNLGMDFAFALSCAYQNHQRINTLERRLAALEG